MKQYAGAHLSCKSMFVAALIRELHQHGHRTLVFSQSRVMLDIMNLELQKLRLRFLRIDGSLSGPQREVRLIVLQLVMTNENLH